MAEGRLITLVGYGKGYQVVLAARQIEGDLKENGKECVSEIPNVGDVWPPSAHGTLIRGVDEGRYNILGRHRRHRGQGNPIIF